MPSFDRTRSAIAAGIVDGMHRGAQLYISHQGRPLVDEAFGEARQGVPMDPDFITSWFSAGKPLTAIALAQFVEAGRLRWDTVVAEVIPEFAAHGKDRITLCNILTHTAGLHSADHVKNGSWSEKIAAICEASLPSGWLPGERGAYSTRAGWYILGEVLQRHSRTQLEDHVRAQIMEPAGMPGTYLAVPAPEIGAIRNRLASIEDTTGSASRPLGSWTSDEGLETCVPGSSARGPVRELGRLYEMLLSGGAPILSYGTIEEMTAPQRTTIFDETFQYRIACGLGFILNSNRDGTQMPYGYGRNASPSTFGHSGNQTSCAFADPARQLVVAWACNGMPGERRHGQRQRLINNAIYDDLAEILA